MKKLILFFIMCNLISCSADKDTKPTVKIKDASYDGISLAFTIESTRTEELTYSVYKFSEASGETFNADPLSNQKITIESLEDNTKYIIKVIAYNGNKSTEDVQIIETLFSSVPYFKTILIKKFTGTWCGYCPQMTKALDQMEELMPGRSIVISIHANDEYKTEYTVPLEELFEIAGYPTSVLDYQYNSTQQILMLESTFEKTMSVNKAVTGVGIKSSIEGNKIKVDADVEFGVKGNYKIACAITEDKLYSENTMGSVDDYYHHVLRHFATDSQGDLIGEMATGSKKSFEFSFTNSDGWILENCNIVVYIFKENSDGIFTVNNGNHSKVGGSAKIKLEE